MSKVITDFTWAEFWKTQELYNDMMCAIEERALEIAKSLGENYEPYMLIDVYFSHDSYREYVNAQFAKTINGVEEFHVVKFDSDWLFSDDYKKELDEKAITAKLAEEREYQEYLRLKAKFEPYKSDMG